MKQLKETPKKRTVFVFRSVKGVPAATTDPTTTSISITVTGMQKKGND